MATVVYYYELRRVTVIHEIGAAVHACAKDHGIMSGIGKISQIFGLQYLIKYSRKIHEFSSR